MRIRRGLGMSGLVVGVALALAPFAPALAADEKNKQESKPAEAKPAEAKPGETKPAEEKKKPEKPKTPWSTYSAEDGKAAWAEPSGWVLDEKSSVQGKSMMWNEPEASGNFRIVAYPKTGASIEDLVKAASFGGKPKVSKPWVCAQGEHGDQKIAVAARVLENGDTLMVVLSTSPSSFKWLGGLPGVRLAADAIVGFKATTAEASLDQE